MPPEEQSAWLRCWWLSPEGKSCRSAYAKRFIIAQPAPASFLFQNIPPDRHTINMQLSSSDPAASHQTIAQFSQTLTVPETSNGTGDRPLDLGTLEAQPAP